ITSRETFTSALAGPLVNARATAAGVARCAPTAGNSRIARGSNRRASPTARGCVAPMTAPTEESPCSPTRSAPHSATSSATWCQTGRPSERTRSCTSAPPAFDVLTTQKMPAPSRRQAARNGSSESRPRYGFTVTASASAGLPFADSRYAVAYARGRPDVAALRVGDHLQPRRARVGANVLESAHAVGAERLEEGDLRLDRDHVRRHRIDEPTAETRAGVRSLSAAEMGIALELDGEEIRPRVEPDDEL